MMKTTSEIIYMKRSYYYYSHKVSHEYQHWTQALKMEYFL